MSFQSSLTVFTSSLVFVSGIALACGTHPPDVQSKIDAAELSSLRTMASNASREADRILIGTVTSLVEPTSETDGLGSVTMNVHDMLKGQASESASARWKPRFVYSCQPSEMFRNVGFRLHGKFIVYIRDGEVIRSEAADNLRSGLLSLDEERLMTSTGSELPTE